MATPGPSLSGPRPHVPRATRLAGRVTDLDVELKSNRDQLTAIVTDRAPHLLALTGVGAVTAAVVLCAWSHPGRVRSEAAMAQIAGTCPIPASSGNTVRHRLNRGGDRRLNWAFNTVVLTRMRTDPATRDYVARRTAEGKTSREIRRCLKRYTTRQIYRNPQRRRRCRSACFRLLVKPLGVV